MNYKVFLTSSDKAKRLKQVANPCIVVIEPEDFTKDEIKALKEKGYTVLGYLSIGSVSDEQPLYFNKLRPYTLKRLEDWPHEYYLDLRRTAVRDWCVSRAKEIKALKCDGWWLDNVDVYEEYESSATYNAVISTLRRIKGLGGYVMINGGSKFLSDKMDGEAHLAVYKVQCGAFRLYENAEELARTLKKNNISTIIKTERSENDTLYKVQVGAFSDFSNAYARMCGVKSLGINAIIKLEGTNTKEIDAKSFIDGVTQEEVITQIKDYSGKGQFGNQESKQSNWYKEYMCRVKTHGMETFLLEYTGDQKVVTKIKKFVKDYGMTGYYASSDVNL